MRHNPQRIDEIVDALRDYWKRYPELRLGQLLDNLHHAMRQQTQSQANIFNTEDSEWLKWLKTHEYQAHYSGLSEDDKQFIKDSLIRSGVTLDNLTFNFD